MCGSRDIQAQYAHFNLITCISMVSNCSPNMLPSISVFRLALRFFFDQFSLVALLLPCVLLRFCFALLWSPPLWFALLCSALLCLALPCLLCSALLCFALPRLAFVLHFALCFASLLPVARDPIPPDRQASWTPCNLPAFWLLPVSRDPILLDSQVSCTLFILQTFWLLPVHGDPILPDRRASWDLCCPALILLVLFT